MSDQQSLPRRLSAILFADIQGFTAMMQKSESSTMKLLLRYETVLAAACEQYNGQIIKNYGDGSICLFTSAKEAVLCAIDLQKEFIKYPPIPLRIGLHEGDVIFSKDDVFGDSINVTSRIESMGIAGNILLSQPLARKVKNQDNIELKSLGHFEFKNVDDRMEVFAVANDGLVIPERKQLKGKFKEKKPFIQNRAIWIAAVILLILTNVFWNKLDGIIGKKSLDKVGIAVLPFANLSGDQDQEYYAFGMQEELNRHLAQIKNLRVISKTSTMKYRDGQSSIPEIAKDLSVDYIVEGSLMRYGDSVRIRIQLIHAIKNEDNLWNRIYDTGAEGVLEMHTEVTRDIAQGVQLILSPEEKEIFSKKRVVNPQAYEALLRGKFHIFKFTPQDIQLGLQYFQTALAIDSTFADAYAAISATGGFLLVSGALPPNIAAQMMHYNAAKSIQLDPDLGSGYSAFASAETWSSWDWERAQEAWGKAISLDPNDPTTLIYYSHFLACMGRFDEAIEYGQKALDLDPFNAFFHSLYGVTLMLSGAYDEAHQQCLKAQAMDPHNPFTLYPLAGIENMKGNKKAALQLLVKFNQAMGDTAMVRVMEKGNEEGGVKEGFIKAAESLIERRDYTYVRPHLIVIFYDMGGESEQAMNWLDSCYVYRDHDMVYANQAPYSHELKSNPRYKALMEKMKFPSVVE